MAEALVIALIDRLTSFTLNKVQQDLKLVTGVDKEIANLTSRLEGVAAVLEDVEQRQVQEAAVKHWLRKMKQVSEEMDDVLDEWSTEILKQQIVGSATKKKVCFSIPSSYFCFCHVNRVVQRHDIAKRIKDLSEKLTSIDADRASFGFKLIKRSSEHLKHQKTSSLLDISFGRADEEEVLVRKLLDEGSQEGRVPLVIPIVGMGGIGKTTLSQLVYNDEKVKAHFNKRIWICVSNPFEEIQILAAIAEGLGIEKHPESNVLETYSQFIFQRIEGMKFLLVLDDVWNPSDSQWEQVIKPLGNGHRGSRILMSTRNEKVAIMRGAATHMIRLKKLNEEYCRALFFHFASSGREISDSRMIEVGNELVRRCQGLPLAAKTLGSLMRSKRTLRDWEGVLNSRIWEIEEFEENVFKPLLLSYHDLAPTTRRCLLFCSIFPKDYEMDRIDLLNLWMSQGYLNLKEKTGDVYAVGQTYFDDLVMRSFFQDFEYDDEENIRCCKMHDIVHDFVHYLTNNEFSILDVRNPNQNLKLPNNKVRHLTLIFEYGSRFFPCENLRTVIIFGSGTWEIGVEFLFQLKSLRTLNMSKYRGSSIPKEIGGLIHLRYLNLSWSWFEELPETICDLYNLQTLVVVGCPKLRKLPKGVGKLINLKHLDVRSCSTSLSLKGIEKLDNLQILK